MKMIYRIGVYFGGILLATLGIVLCVKSELGVSPISSVPYGISLFSPLTFGTLTMLYHFINSIFQYAVERKLLNVKVFLQIPVAFLFGLIIDLLKDMLTFTPQNLFTKLLLVIFSILFTALGMHLMLSMKLVQNPPDGTVNLIAGLSGKNIGAIKIAYDATMVILSAALTGIALHKVIGFGPATICSALFVGRALTLFQKTIKLKAF